MIEIDSPEDEKLLLAILPKFNARVLEKKESSKPSLKDVLEELSQSGVAEKIW